MRPGRGQGHHHDATRCRKRIDLGVVTGAAGLGANLFRALFIASPFGGLGAVIDSHTWESALLGLRQVSFDQHRPGSAEGIAERIVQLFSGEDSFGFNPETFRKLDKIEVRPLQAR